MTRGCNFPLSMSQSKQKSENYEKRDCHKMRSYETEYLSINIFVTYLKVKVQIAN